MRKYLNKIPKYGDLIPIDRWESSSDEAMEDDGDGYWSKDNMYSDDDVFNTPKEDATHVMWFNK